MSMDVTPLRFHFEQKGELRALLTTEGYVQIHEAALNAMLDVLSKARERYPKLEAALLDVSVQHSAEHTAYLAISDYLDDNCDPVFDSKTMPEEAKKTLAALKRAKAQLDSIPMRSRLWLSEIDLFIPDLDPAIAFFGKNFPYPGRQANVRLYNALRMGITTFETLTKRRFRRNVEQGDDEVFSNPDARALLALMNGIDPRLSAVSVGSAIQKIFKTSVKPTPRRERRRKNFE